MAPPIRGPAVALVLLLSCGACGGDPSIETPLAPRGPSRVRMDVVRKHARQFARETPRRPAGSQEEGIAATYILGHLQKAGYLVRLENVPVANLVRSSDVLALPPSGDDPEIIVTVPYDTPPGQSGGGLAIGLFLELARAAHVRQEGHSIEFAALGAERARVDPGRLGSRRLAQLLLDDDVRPAIVSLDDVSEGGAVRAAGDLAADVAAAGRRLGIEVEVSPAADDVYARAGFDVAVVGGRIDAVDDVVLGFLTSD